ncbi:MAG TPA: hypothetical protein VJG13_06540 [Thermoanaerobaculia bacterium]|nr:hypothetical protein [Thermoanaerobaculia bacterium]
MNVGRFLGAVLGVWVVRTVLNFLFYGMAMSSQHEALAAAHPGVFREVIPGFVATDLLFALLFVYLWVKTGPCFGGGIKGGVVGGAWLGVLLGVVVNLYWYFSVTFMSPTDLAIDAVYTIVALAIQGAVAAAIYKVPEVVPARAA